MKQRPYIKGAPLKSGGGHDSTMCKEKSKANVLKQPGETKYGSNTMSPTAKEGRVNTYGE